MLIFKNVGLRHALVQAMSEWYVRSDHDHVKLSRILDIAQDLKVRIIIITIIFRSSRSTPNKHNIKRLTNVRQTNKISGEHLVDVDVFSNKFTCQKSI